MRLLQQTGGSPENSLVEYMRKFNIVQGNDEIIHYPKLKLKHVLDLFERVEDTQHEFLIDRTDPKYQAPLDDSQKSLLDQILRQIP